MKVPYVYRSPADRQRAELDQLRHGRYYPPKAPRGASVLPRRAAPPPPRRPPGRPIGAPAPVSFAQLYRGLLPDPGSAPAAAPAVAVTRPVTPVQSAPPMPGERSLLGW